VRKIQPQVSYIFRTATDIQKTANKHRVEQNEDALAMVSGVETPPYVECHGDCLSLEVQEKEEWLFFDILKMETEQQHCLTLTSHEGRNQYTSCLIISPTRLGKICFVPVLLPVGVEQGGFVVYKPDLCRFEQTLAGNKGFLGFTCLPVLPEDLSPPQVP
jgi:hypothetical protein